MKRLAFIALFGAIAWVGLFDRSDTRSPQPAAKSFSDPTPISTVTAVTPASVATAATVETKQAPTSSKLPPIDFDALRARFGKADSDTSTAYDNPRPPLVTRTMVFNRYRLKVMMLANGKVGDPPPYKGWLLIGLLDPKTNAVLSDDEVQRRIAGSERGTLEERPREQPTARTTTIVLTAAAIAAAIVQESRSAYYATGKPCACPDDKTRTGRRCGGNSAYSRPGGAQPLCYPDDVPSEAIEKYRLRMEARR